MDRGACQATAHGIAESDTTERLSLSLIYHFTSHRILSGLKDKELWYQSSLEPLS